MYRKCEVAVCYSSVCLFERLFVRAFVFECVRIMNDDDDVLSLECKCSNIEKSEKNEKNKTNESIWYVP